MSAPTSTRGARVSRSRGNRGASGGGNPSPATGVFLAQSTTSGAGGEPRRLERTCSRCGEPFTVELGVAPSQQTLGGARPFAGPVATRCDPCRVAAKREQYRPVVRTPGVCVDCGEPTVVPKRGRMPDRCPGCARRRKTERRRRR